jgi:hypothetical protein
MRQQRWTRTRPHPTEISQDRRRRMLALVDAAQACQGEPLEPPPPLQAVRRELGLSSKSALYEACWWPLVVVCRATGLIR